MYKTILLPVDLAHLDEGRKTLQIALSIAGEDTKILLLYVIEDIPNWADLDLPLDFMANSKHAARESLQSIAAVADREVKIEIHTGHAYSTILKVAEASGADLIILASHKPGLIDYFIGSNTTKVVGHANCSVLVVR